jgi:hypothetical protein
MGAVLTDLCTLCISLLSITLMIAIGAVLVAIITADHHRDRTGD